MRTWLWVAIVLAPIFAGCVTQSPTVLSPPAPGDQRILLPALAKPDLGAPVSFKLFEPVATGFLGEPTLVSNASGSLFLSFPGSPGGKRFVNGPVYRSIDVGESWDLMNPEDDGSLAEDSPRANGDAMLAIDAAGTIYASNLGDRDTSGRLRTPVWSSHDGGVTWIVRGNPVPSGTGSDRQWAWAGPPGVLVMDWMQTSPSRQAAIAISHDSGEKFGRVFTAGEPIGWIGTVTGDENATKIFAAYTLPLTASEATKAGAPPDAATALLLTDSKVELRFLRTLDGGKTWSDQSTGYVIDANPAHLQWSGTLMAPILQRTGSGRLVYVWSEENMDAQGRAQGAPQAQVKVMTSDDDGTTWTAPAVLSASRTGIMPWVIAGGGNSFATAYYAASDVHLLNDYEGTWDVEVVFTDGSASSTPQVVAPNVHKGGICTRGGVCFLTASDRTMLDFLGGTLLPDGRVAVAYASTPDSPAGAAAFALGSSTSAHVAIQQTGPKLL